MALHIQNHLLFGECSGRSVRQDLCTGKDSGTFTGDRPDTVVIHFTAGSTLESAVSTLKNPEVKASAHLVIDRTGDISQLVGFNRIAWHAGRSRWRDRSGLNRYSIGIELVNAGELTPSGDRFLSWFGRPYDRDETVRAVHRNQSEPKFWHAYTEEQLTVCFEVCRILRQSYPITYILGHEEIAPDRKVDPGPAFPLDRLRDRILTGRDDTGDPTPDPQPPEEISHETATETLPDTATVTASLLNFRLQPHRAALAAGDPLPLGKEVRLLERSGKWCRVKVCTEGWVHGDYLRFEK